FPQLEHLTNYHVVAHRNPTTLFYEIPDRQALSALSTCVIQFIGDNSPDTLLIFYYAGHGSIHEDRNDAIWDSNQSEGSPSMPSSGIQGLLEEARSDVIMLHDTCHSADTSVTRRSQLHGVTELIAACGFETTAPGPGQHSFTAALTICLQRLHADSVPFSVSDLFSKIIAQLRNNGLRPLKQTPVHCSLTTEQSGRRIMLHPVSVYRPVVPVGEHEWILSLPIRVEVKHHGLDDTAAEWNEWILKAPAGAISVDLEHPDSRRRFKHPDGICDANFCLMVAAQLTPQE
ncbi:hypothetical protein LOCC1_G008506, partial [Lachnellula occidentalis]